MDIGIVTRSFPDMSTKEAVKFIKEAGFKSVELCFSQTDCKYWKYNSLSDISELTKERVSDIVKNYTDRCIEIVSIGVFTNLLEPDDDLRKKNLEYFVKHMDFAADNKIKYLSTECGFIPGRRGINADTYEKDYQLLHRSMAFLIEEAEKRDVYIALEPCVLDVVPSAKRTRDFIVQTGSQRVKVLLDPANLIANSSEEDMFFYLKDHIAYFHGKDRKVNDAYGKTVGSGDIDWVKFLGLYSKYTPGKPFILEYVNKDNCEDIKDRVLDFYKRI